MVNAAGRRFTNEASPYDEVGKAMHRADDGGGQNDPAFLIFDGLHRGPPRRRQPGITAPY
jgi:FAD binding domain